jgi:hypothetical protein
MEEEINKIMRTRNKYLPRRQSIGIMIKEYGRLDIPSEIIKEIVVGKLKNAQKYYKKMHELRKTARINGNYDGEDVVIMIYTDYSKKMQKWLDLWQAIMGYEEKLDAKLVKSGHTPENVLNWYGKEIRNHKTYCIAHDDKHPSMHVYPDGVHCFSCGYHGDVIDIVMRLEKVDFHTALRRLNTLK